MKIRSQVRRNLPDVEKVALAAPSVLGSAAMLSRQQLGLVARAAKPMDWQQEAWDHYRTVVELMFGVNWRAAAVSRCPLIIARREDNSETPIPVENAKAEALLAQLFADSGRANALYRMVVQLDVAGETYLVGLDKLIPAAGNIDPEAITPLESTRWIVVSRDEITGTDIAPTVRLPETGAEVLLGEGYSTVIRLWWQDPQHAWKPMSTTQALVIPLREINTISRSITAAGKSRLAGPGMLAVAESVYGHQSPDDEGKVHPFMRDLADAMGAAISDPDSPAAHVPICFPAPDNLIGKVFEHVRFSDPYDPKAVEQRASAIGRVATGLDMPAEIITGMSQGNHWSAWKIDESAVKLHIEPMLELLCDAITHQFLLPALQATGGEADLCVWYDATPITTRPNQGPDALKAHAQDIVGAETVLREFGWDPETDAPTEEERQQRLLLRLMDTMPELRTPLLPLLLEAVGITLPRQVISLPGQPAAPESPAIEAPEAEPGIPETDGNPSQPSVTSSAAMLTAIDGAVLRALELINKRRMTRGARAEVGDLPPWTWQTKLRVRDGLNWSKLLAGALDTLPEVLPCPECVPCVARVVERYTRGLIVSGEIHAQQRQHLIAALRHEGCLDA